MSHSIHFEKLKHFLYLISMGILVLLSALILIRSVSDFTGLDFLQTQASNASLSLILFFGTACLISILLMVSGFLSSLSEKNLIRLTIILAALGFFLQCFLLFYLRPVLRYDHLLVFDGALEILQTGKLSLSANDSYFGLYPFNISITVFHSMILRLLQLFGMDESHLMLGLQGVYLILIDLGVFFSWKIVRILYSTKHAALFAVLCFFNPILYTCASGCYTTTLMMPLLMGTLLLFVLFLREQEVRKKWILGFFSGVVLALGSRLRATVFIAGIALVIYLLIRAKSAVSAGYGKKRLTLLAGSVLLGAVLSFSGFTHLQNTVITEDYTDTQVPAIYYLMFSANPDTEGTYNEEDYRLVSSLETLEEKEHVSFKILKERLKAMGISGFLSLAGHKLELTWSDGTDDYSDFLTTSRNYSRLHSFIAGDQKDFFAMYCHIFHLAVMTMFLFSAFSMFRQRCDSSRYLIFLTLLGGMIFHIFWEAGNIYSFGFSMLLLIGASDGIAASEQKNKASRIIGIAGAASFLMLFLPCVSKLRGVPYKHVNNAVVQDMSLGEQRPLLTGDQITQTFRTDRRFNRVGCKVLNPSNTENGSHYRMELFSETGELLARSEIKGDQVQDKDYCYLEVNTVIPEKMNTYTIRITPIYTTETQYLTFACFNTHHYDIYPSGSMTGLNGDEKSDLTFRVFERTETNFFH